MQKRYLLSDEKMHNLGLKNRKWNLGRKLKIYEAIADLHAKEKEIVAEEAQEERKKVRDEMYILRRDIKETLRELNDAYNGEHLLLRRTLVGHKGLQLAYQNRPPAKVIDSLKQENFRLRKDYDMLNYKLKKTTQKLIDLKLAYGELEDAKKFADLEKSPHEEEIQVLQAKIKDARMKIEAAMAIKQTYHKILDILKKDSSYFEAVKASLYADAFNQARVVRHLSRMNKMAKDDFDEKSRELEEMEREFKINKKIREQSIKDLQEKIELLKNNIKHLARQENESANPSLDESRDSDCDMINDEIEGIENILNQVQASTLASSFEDILPRIQEQERQLVRLEEQITKSAELRDILFKKTKHLEEVYNNLFYNADESTFWYKKEEARIKGQIEETKKRRKEIQDITAHRGQIAVGIRSDLQEIAMTLRTIQKSGKGDDQGKTKKSPREKRPKTPIPSPKPKQSPKGKPLTCPLREPVEDDPKKLVALILDKLRVLVSAAPDPLYEEISDKTVAMFQDVCNRCGKHMLDEVEAEEDLVPEIDDEVDEVPTREEIKANSAWIAEINAPKEEDLVATVAIKKS